MGKIKIEKALHIEQAKEAGRYSVTQVRGLYLDVRRMREGEIKPMRVWTLRIMHGYKKSKQGHTRPNIVERTIGYHPEVTLSEAREKAILWAREIRAGGEVGKQAKTHKAAPDVVTFKLAAEQVMTLRDGKWKSDVHRRQWRQTLEDYAYPLIGNKPVGEVTQDDIVAILSPLWASKHATASKLRSRLGMILGWAKAAKLRTDNPARENDTLGNLLPTIAKSTKHHAAMPYQQAPAFMLDLRRLDSVSALALEFTILTGCRTSEVLEAKWSEIDGQVWVIPAARMKGGGEHRVPLSPTALAVLERVRALGLLSATQLAALESVSERDDLPSDARGWAKQTHAKGSTDWIFPSRFSHLSNMAMLQCLRGLRPGLTVHGFRSTFRDWAADQTDYPHEVVEAALAHVVTDAVVRAYRRTSFFDKRRDLMNDWAAYLAGEQPAAKDEAAELIAKLKASGLSKEDILAALG